jgi:U3 small nucleolar RNA-associated protein 11
MLSPLPARRLRLPPRPSPATLPDSLHRRNHKERSQLVGRQRLGLLEKHKDYVLRARDYASKKQRIKRLQEKVAERNKDEFYFGMTASKTQVHIPVSLCCYSTV